MTPPSIRVAFTIAETHVLWAMLTGQREPESSGDEIVSIIEKLKEAGADSVVGEPFKKYKTRAKP